MDIVTNLRNSEILKGEKEVRIRKSTPNIFGIHILTGKELGGPSIGIWPWNCVITRWHKYSLKRLVRIMALVGRLGLDWRWDRESLVILNEKKKITYSEVLRLLNASIVY